MQLNIDPIAIKYAWLSQIQTLFEYIRRKYFAIYFANGENRAFFTSFIQSKLQLALFNTSPVAVSQAFTCEANEKKNESA